MNKQTQALKLALENICAAKLCEINSMSSRHEMIRLMDAAITAIREALADSALDRMAENARELGIQMQPEQKPIARLQWADGWTVTLLTGAEDIPLRSGPYALYVGPAPEQPAQQQEPVAWGVDWGRAGDQSCVSIIKRLQDGGIEVLATEYGQPASKPWVGLTDEDLQCFDADAVNTARYWEAKLRELNEHREKNA